METSTNERLALGYDVRSTEEQVREDGVVAELHSYLETFFEEHPESRGQVLARLRTEANSNFLETAEGEPFTELARILENQGATQITALIHYSRLKYRLGLVENMQ